MEDENDMEEDDDEDIIRVPVLFLDDKITYLHVIFNEEYPDLAMSRTSFWRNIPKYFSTKGQKRTDVCHICEYGKKIMKIRSLTQDEELNKKVDTQYSSIILLIYLYLMLLL